MAEEGRQKEVGKPSPVDSSAEARLRRFEARMEWRRSPEGQAVKEVREEEKKQRELKERVEREMIRLGEGEQRISSQAEQILLQAAGAIGKLAEIQEKIAKGDYSIELPGDEEGQRRYVRTLLDGIENSNRECYDWTISTVVKNLEATLDRMHPAVAEEVKARLAVHDSSELMKQAGGWIERKADAGSGYSIGSAATEAARRGHELTRQVIDVLLRRGLPGLKISEAWDLLQNANFYYRGFVEEVNKQRKVRGEKPFNMEKEGFELRDDEIEMGKVPTSFFTDSNSARKEAVSQLIEEKLGGGDVGRKSLQIAEKLTIASLETSVFNRTAMTGNDELAEIIGLKGWRKGRAEPGRARGPEIHEDKIPGFGTSWLRRFSKTKKSIDEPFYSKDIDIDKITEGNYLYYCTAVVGRYHALRKLLLDRRPQPFTIDKTFLQEAVAYFNNADPPPSGCKCGDLKLRVWWLAGVVDMALADINLKWNARAFSELRKAAIQEGLSETAGTFITPKQWEWIEKTTKFKERLRDLSARKAIGVVGEKTFPF